MRPSPSLSTVPPLSRSRRLAVGAALLAVVAGGTLPATAAHAAPASGSVVEAPVQPPRRPIWRR